MLTEISHQVEDVVTYLNNLKQTEKTRSDWILIGAILDRCFLILFTLVSFIFTLVMFANISQDVNIDELINE